MVLPLLPQPDFVVSKNCNCHLGNPGRNSLTGSEGDLGRSDGGNSVFDDGHCFELSLDCSNPELDVSLGRIVMVGDFRSLSSKTGCKILTCSIGLTRQPMRKQADLFERRRKRVGQWKQTWKPTNDWRVDFCEVWARRGPL